VRIEVVMFAATWPVDSTWGPTFKGRRLASRRSGAPYEVPKLWTNFLRNMLESEAYLIQLEHGVGCYG
jgi:hypothetical protein